MCVKFLYVQIYLRRRFFSLCTFPCFTFIFNVVDFTYSFVALCVYLPKFKDSCRVNFRNYLNRKIIMFIRTLNPSEHGNIFCKLKTGWSLTLKRWDFSEHCKIPNLSIKKPEFIEIFPGLHSRLILCG